MTDLFAPLRAGDLTLPNRIVMAPLTRNRASMPGRVPNALMRTYYQQRASAGLILTEATSVSAQGVGYPSTPGIWSEEQTRGWRAIVEGVHQAGGRIAIQLWHVGRISDPSYHDGALPVSSSALPAKGRVSLLRPARDYVVPRALLREEIPGVIESYRRAAQNALEAGFDGVELHAANGYLIDQFLQDGVNQREDDYGGSLENRARLLLEVTDALSSVVGAGRVGVHLAPRGDAHDMSDSDPARTFGYVARELGARNIAFLCVRESTKGHRYGPALREAFGGVYIANEGFTRESATELLQKGEADAVAFGKAFISNPDLVARFQRGDALTPWRDDRFYSEGPEGYTDYPTASDARETQPSL